MRNYIKAIFCIIFFSAFIDGENKNEDVFYGLFALEGKWIMNTKNGAIGEEWIKLNSHYLQNRGYMIRGSDTIITERVALRNTKEGIFFTSTVEDQNRQQPVAFQLTSSGNNTFVFENPGHDYPKRISYQFINKDSLYAWIDDGKEIPEKKSSFRYSRNKK